MIIESVHADKDIKWLKSKGYLEEMDSSECQDFLAAIHKGLVQDGTCLFEKGEEDNGIFIIQRGKVEIGHSSQECAPVDQGGYGMVDCSFHDFDDGDWLDHVILKEGDCVGEMGAMMGQPHQWTARSIGPVELFHIETRRLQELTKQNIKVCQCIAKALNRSRDKLGQN